MAVQPETVKTDVDALLELIRRRKEISFEEASKTLVLPPPTIEAWATFLEEEGLVTIKYKFTTPFFVYKAVTDKDLATVTPYAIVDDAMNVHRELSLYIKGKDFARARQKAGEVRDKLGSLPASFMSEHNDLINGIGDTEKKMNDLLFEFFMNKNTSVEKGSEMEYLLSEFSRKLDVLKKLAGLATESMDRKKGTEYDEMGIERLSEKKDTKRMILGLTGLMSKYDAAWKNNDVGAAQQLYMDINRHLRELRDEVQKEAGIEPAVQKKFDRGISSADQLIEAAAAALKAGDTKKVTDSLMRTGHVLHEILFVMRTIYDEKQLIEKKEILRSEVENIEPLLARVYSYIKEGKLDSAKDLYRDLEEKYVMLPTEFIEKKNTLKKDLIKLNRDLALSIAEKSRIEMDAKSRVIKKLMNQALSALTRNDITPAGEAYDKIEQVFRDLPDGFVDERTTLQHTILELQRKLINRKMALYSGDLRLKTERINAYLSHISKLIEQKKPDEAIEAYEKVRELFGMLPDGYLEEKTALQNRILALHKEVLVLKMTLQVDAMREKSGQINELLKKANQLVRQNDIKGANQLFDQIEDIYITLPDGFLVMKTQLQNKILAISDEISRRLDRIAAAEFQTKQEQLKEKVKKVNAYVKSKNHDLAFAEYEEIINLYNQFPTGFIEQRTKVRAELLNLYRIIIGSTDAFLINTLDDPTKKKYEEILKLLVRMHEHIDHREFDMLQTLYDRIAVLYQDLPVDFVQKKSKIVSDINIMFTKIRMFQLCQGMQDMVRDRDFAGLRDRLNEIYSLYNQSVDQSYEDIELFNFIYNKYFTYHKILLEEQRIRGGILMPRIPDELLRRMPTGEGGQISQLRQRLDKAEAHVSDLNFDFVKPLKDISRIQFK